MRVAKCENCGALLPEGGRIDRRYCREACRAVAYRQRRQNNAHASGQTGGSKKPDPDAKQPHLSLALSQLLTQVVDEVSALKRRLTSLEDLVKAQAARPAISRDGLEGESYRQVPVNIHSTPLPDRSDINSPPSELNTADPPAPARSAADTAHRQSAPPWMTVVAGAADAVIPTWTLWPADFLQSVDSYAERMLGSVPELVALEGREDEANQLRQWLTDDRTLVRQCAFIMARRIAATHLAERQSAVQRLKLAALVSRNLSDFIGWKDATEKERGELSLASNQDKLTLVAAVLAVGLRTIENTGART